MDVLNLISSVGFPIAACFAMAYFVKYQQDSNNREVAELRKEHAEEVQKMTEAINNNTLALTKLVERIEREV